MRQDLQSSLKFNSETFNITSATNTTIINTTGYFRFFGLMSVSDVGTSTTIEINIFDGTTSKILLNGRQGTSFSGVGVVQPILFDFIAKINAGESVRGSASSAGVRLSGIATQIASIDGTLT